MSIELTRFDTLLLFSYASSLFLLISSFRRELPGARTLGILVAPAVLGFLMLTILMLNYLGNTTNMFSRITENRWSLAATLTTILVAASVTEVMLTRLAEAAKAIIIYISRFVRREEIDGYWIPDATRIPVFIILSIILFVLIEIVSAPQVSGAGNFTVESAFSLPGAPTSVALMGESNGYIALGDGRILRFELPREPDGELLLETVAEGISYPHGMVILNDNLYVTHQGPFDCQDDSAVGAFAGIRCAKLPDLSARDSQISLLESTRGGVVAYDILADGSLGDMKTILSDLPVATGDHAVNALAVGPDGMLYLSIGGLDVLAAELDVGEILQSIERPNKDLIGSIVRFAPDGSNLEVFASGIRNIYTLVFDNKGRLYGIDNSGLNNGGWRFEEVLQINQGDYYGHPFQPTFSSSSERTPPVWLLDGAGSAGLERAEDLGLNPGLLIGSRNQIVYLHLNDLQSGVAVRGRDNIETVLEPEGFVTFLKATSNHRLLAGVFGLRANEHVLLVLRSNLE